MNNSSGYRPRFFLIIFIAVVVGQYMSINYLRKDFEQKINECYNAINTSSIMQGALINILEEKKVLDKTQLLKEAEKLSSNLNDMIENIRKQEGQESEKEKTPGEDDPFSHK